MEISIEDYVFKQLYEQLETIVKEKSLTLTNVVDIVVNLMIIVEQFPKLTGEQKKESILKVLKFYLEKNLSDKPEILSFVETVLPTLIDTLISIDKNEVEIKVKSCFKSIKDAFKCCKC